MVGAQSSRNERDVFTAQRGVRGEESKVRWGRLMGASGVLIRVSALF